MEQEKRHKLEGGFTLIEIMVALFLVTIILTLVSTSSHSLREDLDQSLEIFERGFRFSTDEAALRNSMVRIHVDLDKEPQELVVEYGPDDSFVLPAATNNSVVLSKEEEEAKQKEQEEINKKFNKVREFQEKTLNMAQDIRIIGVANGSSESLVSSGEFSFYTYPTGERDRSLIILASEEEIAVIKTEPFLQEYQREYIPLGQTKGIDIMERQDELAKDYYENWRRK